jgi:streptogramin lyase
MGSGQTQQVDPGLYTVKRVMGSGGGINFAPDNTSATASGTGVPQDSGAHYGIAVAQNGDVYYADALNNVVRRVNAAGLVKTIAGSRGATNNNCTARGDGLDSVTGGRLAAPHSLAFGRDGELYIWDAADYTIRRLRPTGPDNFTIDTVAGVPCVQQSTWADDVPALGSPLGAVDEIAVGPDGVVFVADRSNNRIRKFAIGGKITTVAGNGNGFERREGARAREVGIGQPTAIAVGRDGSVYSSSGLDLYKVTPDGIMHLLSAPYPASTATQRIRSIGV